MNEISNCAPTRAVVCRVWRVALLLTIALGLSGCGGSSGGGGGGSNPAVLVLSLAPGSATIASGSTTSFTVSGSGASTPIAVTLSGLPAGVTGSPSSFSLAPGGSQAVQLTAQSSAASAVATITVHGTAGSATATAAFTLTVQHPAEPPAGTRTKYLRTDGSGGTANAAVYDAGRNRFFLADPQIGRVLAIDPASESVVGSVAVPGALGLDETADGTTLWVGTQLGDVYSVDVASMQVSHRYVAAGIGAGGFGGYQVRVLANGRLALLGGQGGIVSVDGYSRLGIWDPLTNSLSTYSSAYDSPFGTPGITIICGPLLNIGGFTLSGDRTRVLLGSADSDATLCSFDPVSGNFQTVTSQADTIHITPSPDGNLLVLPGQRSLTVYNAHTLGVVSSFTVSGDTSSAASLLISQDSRTVYITSASSLFAYDLASGQQTGWASNLFVPAQISGLAVSAVTGPALEAVDNTGLLFGPMAEGVGFLDTAALHTGPVGEQLTNGYLDPAYGPAAGGTATSWQTYAATQVSQVTFGGVPATGVSQSSQQTFATSPAHAPGPVDVITSEADLSQQFLPEAFSYGPTILEATPDTSPAEGGGTAVVYGYGFGPTSAKTAPGDLQITVGGKAAAITGFGGNAYGTGSPPSPLEAVLFTVPAGTSAADADITVTNGSGSTTLARGLHYTPASQLYPLAGAALAQGVYDPKRDLYYFTNASEVEVFSRSAGKWLSPITVPAPPAGMQHRLWSLGLSPNGSMLAVSDVNTAQMFLIDPSRTRATQTFLFAPQLAGGVGVFPAGVVISDSGVMYLGAAVQGTGFPGYFSLDTATGTITPLVSGPGLPTDVLLRLAISADNARLYLGLTGEIASLDLASGNYTYSNGGQGCCYGNYELTLSSNQTRLSATEYLLDTDMRAESYYSLNDRERNVSYVYGAKLSPDGTLLFQPRTDGIDILDGHDGTLRQRVATPYALGEYFDALVADGVDNVLVAITGKTGGGVAVIDLTGIAEPPPLPYPEPEHVRASTSLPRGLAGRAPAIPHVHLAGRSPVPYSAPSPSPAQP